DRGSRNYNKIVVRTTPMLVRRTAQQVGLLSKPGGGARLGKPLEVNQITEAGPRGVVKLLRFMARMRVWLRTRGEVGDLLDQAAATLNQPGRQVRTSAG
ncbi:MAG TPA: hypothetical protein VF491_23860, partial [Vicinamibacterales bacterium]